MGRTGVTLQEVEKAALQLQGRGKPPTVDGIRALLGTGSKSTIAQHLRDWKARESQASGKLPQDLLALVMGLWERLNLQADERIVQVETMCDQQMQELKQDLAKSRIDYADLQKLFHQSEEMRIAEQACKEALGKELIQEQQEQAKLLERNQATFRQLGDYKSENARLHQLANNIQANLEHYQHAMQQLRTEQNLILEQQQVQFQQKIAELQYELTAQRNHLVDYEKQIAHNNAELKQFALMREQYEKMKKEMMDCLNQLLLLKERNEQCQQQLHATFNDLNEKNKQIAEFEKKMAILSDNHVRLKEQLLTTEDKIELLRQEKLFLAQEKSELQGHLKQLEWQINQEQKKTVEQLIR